MNYHNLTAPCGTILRRESKTRLYTHAVIMRESYYHALHVAEIKDAKRSRFKAAVRKLFRRPVADSAVAQVEERLAAGHYDYYSALGWYSSYDAARPKYAEYAGRDGVHDLQIVEVEAGAA